LLKRYIITPVDFLIFNMNKLELPKGHKRLLLHSCCAPCSGDIMLRLKESNIDYTIYFYNPNIHPIDEYEIRKDENRRFCEKVGFE